MGKQIPKMSARVVNAIKNLRETHGSTSKEIINYITSHCDVPENSVHRQMQVALKRGLEYGILKKNNGHYFLDTEAELQLMTGIAPMERSRKRRRRGRSRRRRGRRRSRSRRKRRRGRRRRSRRRRSRRRSRGMKARRIGCTRCKCTKRSKEIHALKNNPEPEQQIPEDDTCTCDKESNSEHQSRQSKSRECSLSHSRSSANSDRDGAIDDRHTIHDQD